MIRLSLALALLTSPAWGCDSINLGLISHHWDRDRDYNERHHAIGCTNAVGRWDVMWFKNSNRSNSLFIGDYRPLYKNQSLTLGYDYGLITGYEWAVTPIILPRAQYNTGSVRINGYLLLDAGVAVGLEFDL